MRQEWQALKLRSSAGQIVAAIREFISSVDVSENQIRITGPKAALLAHSAQYHESREKLVPTFGQDWRTGGNSNSLPLDL